LHKSDYCNIVAAMPPDVRRGYAAPVDISIKLGYAPGSACGHKCRASPYRGPSPLSKIHVPGAA